VVEPKLKSTRDFTSELQWGQMPSTKRSARNLFLLTPCPVKVHHHLLLIVFAISLFLFLSHKIVILLEIQVDLLANPIILMREIKSKPAQTGVLCMQRCRCAPEVVEPMKGQRTFE
jgi:hypothetical protein